MATSSESRLKEIRSQLGSLDGISKFFGMREINDLPNILWDDEQITGALQGVYGGGQGLLVATDRRLVFVDRKLIGNRVKVEEFPYEKISSIQYQLKLVFAVVTIFTSGNKAEIEQVMPKQLARSFCDGVQALMASGNGKQSSTEDTESGTIQMIDALERLDKLHERGVLSDTEFEEQKRKILGN